MIQKIDNVILSLFYRQQSNVDPISICKIEVLFTYFSNEPAFREKIKEKAGLCKFLPTIPKRSPRYLFSLDLLRGLLMS